MDKPLLPLGQFQIIHHIVACLPHPILISANGDPGRYAQFGLPVLADEIIGRGPLAGVLRGLEWAATLGAQALLTVPGDTPFIPSDLAARLGEAPAWAESATGLHPLVALWPTDCAAALRAWLATNISGRVRAFGRTIGMRTVRFEDTPDLFHNINTPADLRAAQTMALKDFRGGPL